MKYDKNTNDHENGYMLFSGLGKLMVNGNMLMN